MQDEDGPYRLRWDRGAPPWDEDPFVRESLVAKWSMEHLPEKLKKALDACLDIDSIGAELVSNLKLTLQWIDAWEGVEDIGWHWDGPAQSPVFLLLITNFRTLISNFFIKFGSMLVSVAPGSAIRFR